VSVASKLQIKPGQSVSVINRPPGVDLELSAESTIADDPSAADTVILFTADRAELDERGAPVIEAAKRDALAWVAYPKAGKLGTDLNRDSLAAALRESGTQPVRQVAIDGTWSALRFRPG
jgi:hypothetical protein